MCEQKEAIEVVPIECMGTQYFEVRTYGQTRLVLLEDQTLDLFIKLGAALYDVRAQANKKGEGGRL